MGNRSKSPPLIADNSAELEAEIKRQIAGDTDLIEMPDNAAVLRRGRPRGSNKSQVTVKIDRDVLSVLKSPDAKGWQTRLNQKLREALEL